MSETPDELTTGPLATVTPDPATLPHYDGAVKRGKKDASAEPVCPTCGAVLRIERRTPDFGTHHTRICETCGTRTRAEG